MKGTIVSRKKTKQNIRETALTVKSFQIIFYSFILECFGQSCQGLTTALAERKRFISNRLAIQISEHYN